MVGSLPPADDVTPMTDAGFKCDGVEYVPAWRRDDRRLEADAIEMWSEMGALGSGINPQARAKELAALAYRNGRLIGITTAVLQTYESLRQRFAFMRILMRPSAAEAGVAAPLTVQFSETLRRWSKDNPQEQVAGYAALVGAGPYTPMPVLPAGLTLVGYTDEGHQVRVFWWDHFRIPVS